MSASEVAAALRGLRIEPGLWEVTSAVLDASGENMPREAQARMKGHRRTLRNCVTPEQAARPDESFLRARQGGARCGWRGFRLEGERLSGEMRCTGGGLPGVMTTRMDGIYEPQRYHVRMRMTSTDMPLGANMVIDTLTIGRRIGDCPAAAPQPAEGGRS